MYFYLQIMLIAMIMKLQCIVDYTLNEDTIGYCNSTVPLISACKVNC